MKKHQESIQAIQTCIDELIQRHGQYLILSVSLAIMGDNHEPETVQLMQYGIRDAMVLLLRETLQQAESETGDFIGSQSKPKTIN